MAPTLFLLPFSLWDNLPLLRFYDLLLHADPQLLGLTLAGIAAGLLALRFGDGRPAPRPLPRRVWPWPGWPG